MSDERLGAIPLNNSSELIRSVGAWKGQVRAGARIFVTSSRYTGATKKGLSPRGDVLAGVIEALEAIERQVAVKSASEQARVAKSGRAEVVVGIVASPDGNDANLVGLELSFCVSACSAFGTRIATLYSSGVIYAKMAAAIGSLKIR